MGMNSEEPTGWQEWPVQVGDWVTVLPLDQHAPDLHDQPALGDPEDMQVGHTYQVGGMHARAQAEARGMDVLTNGDITARFGWCRPATPDEIRQAQLSQLQAGGL